VPSAGWPAPRPGAGQLASFRDTLITLLSAGSLATRAFGLAGHAEHEVADNPMAARITSKMVMEAAVMCAATTRTGARRAGGGAGPATAVAGEETGPATAMAGEETGPRSRAPRFSAGNTSVMPSAATTIRSPHAAQARPVRPVTR
jgi:hypothetical protein